MESEDGARSESGATDSKLVELSNWFNGRPDVAARLGALDWLPDEAHTTAHQLMTAVAMSPGASPCAVLQLALAGMFIMGYAQAARDGSAEGGLPPEGDSPGAGLTFSGPILSADDIRRMMGGEDREEKAE